MVKLETSSMKRLIFGQRSQRGWRPVEHRGTFVYLFIRPSICLSPPGPLRPEICPLRPWICPLGPEICPLRPEICPLRPEICPHRPEICPLRPWIGEGRLRPERADFRPERADFRPKRAWGDKQIEGRTKKRINKSPPMFYRTSSHLGRLPKKQPFHLVSSLTMKPYLYLSRCKYDLKKK